MYGSAVWGSTANKNIEKLQTIENACYRLIAGKNRREISNKELHEKFQVTDIKSTIDYRRKRFYAETVKKTPLTKHIEKHTKLQ